MRPHHLRRQVDTREIRDRRSVLAQVMGRLPPSLGAETATLTRGPNQSHVVRGERGQLLAQFHDHSFAVFSLQAPANLRVFMDYISQLEEDAYNDRDRRREAEARLDEVTNELYAANSLGITTKDGQRRVRAAIASVRDRSRRQRD